MNIVFFSDMTGEEWDSYVRRIPEATHMHTSWYLSFLNAIYGKEGCKSFICLEGGEPVAVCPFFMSKSAMLGREYISSERGGFSSIYPAMVEFPAAQRRRIAGKVFGLLEEFSGEYGIKRVELYRHPVSFKFMDGRFDGGNIAEAVSFGYFPYIKNTILIDLQKPEEMLLTEMSKSHRKHIRRSVDDGLMIKEYRGDGSELEDVFNSFRVAHFKSAGRLTRSLESWDMMKEAVKTGKAALFTASISDMTAISYLYCGEFHEFCFGLSQVNLDEYEKEFSPRHSLEWSAMLSYKKRGFKYYELGMKYSLPQFFYVPSAKEVSISQFKERYGGKLYCGFYFEKILDKDIFRMLYESRTKDVMRSNYFEGLKSRDNDE